MSWKTYLRRLFYVGIVFFFIYFIVFRRRSPQVFLNESHVNKYHLQVKHFNYTHIPRIPRIIHQTWKSRDVPLHWNLTVETVRQYNAQNFEYRLWTDDDMREFVREKEPYVYEYVYRTYSLDIQRVDAFRYIVLYHIGGIYIDMDNGCRQSFESLLRILEIVDLKANHLAAYPCTSPIGVSNGFMIATKNHPLFQMLISRLWLFNHNYVINYLTVMLSAGPLYLSINEFYFNKLTTKSAIRIINNIVYSDIYTWHTPGNSWHGRDAKVLLYIYHLIRKSSQKIFYFLLTISCIVLFLLYRRRYKRRKKIF